MKSTRIAALLAVAAIMVLSVGCSTVGPDAGHQIVLVEKPYLFGHGGIENDPITAGRTVVALSTEGVDVNMQPQKYEVEMDDIQTSDGVPITFHAIAVLQITDSVKLISTFGPQWYENDVLEPYKTMVRQQVRHHTMNETAISTEALDQIDNSIKTDLESFLKQKGLPVVLITQTVGKANPPADVKNQRIQTATQEQRIQTEQQTAKAEDQRKVAETARAQADNAYRQALGLSPEQFIELEKIKMQRDACAHGTCIFGNGTPIINTGK
jgi:regulator of protease activity HflC (stomatin/prohibitin superfamily)